MLDESGCRSKKIWLKKGNEFYNRYFESWLQGNNTEMYSTYIEGKSVVAEWFIRTMRNKIYKYIIAVSKNVYIDVLDDIVDEYHNSYHRTIKMKPVDVKSGIYIEYDVEHNDKKT